MTEKFILNACASSFRFSYMYTYIYVCIYIHGVYKAVVPPYISQNYAQNYEKPKNTCLIISRSYSFEKIRKDVPKERLTKKILNGIFILWYIV